MSLVILSRGAGYTDISLISALLDQLGIPLRQGSYYAPPLSADGLRGLL